MLQHFNEDPTGYNPALVAPDHEQPTRQVNGSKSPRGKEQDKRTPPKASGASNRKHAVVRCRLANVLKCAGAAYKAQGCLVTD